MKTWHYVGFWIVMFIAARFFLVNPMLNRMDKLTYFLATLVDLTRNR